MQYASRVGSKLNLLCWGYYFSIFTMKEKISQFNEKKILLLWPPLFLNPPRLELKRRGEDAAVFYHQYSSSSFFSTMEL